MKLLTDISLFAAPLTLAAAIAVMAAARRLGQMQANRPVGRYGRVKVDRSKITADMHVPALDGSDHRGDFECGHVAATLFDLAVQTGALSAPTSVQIACYPDCDIAGGGFVLVAYPDGGGFAWGTTTGYCAADVIGTADPSQADALGTVVRALEVFARELNTSLAGLEAHVRQSRSRRRVGHGWRLHGRRATSDRRQPARPTPADRRALLLAVNDARECVALILQQAAVAPDDEVIGLTSALECLLSLDERAAATIVEQARRRHG